MKEYLQCRLTNGTMYTHGWIEKRGAKVGAKVDVLDLDGLWEVLDVGSYSMTSEELSEKERARRNGSKSIKVK